MTSHSTVQWEVSHQTKVFLCPQVAVSSPDLEWKSHETQKFTAQGKVSASLI